MHARLNKKDGQQIWRYFRRFAEYDDLKDLYKKVIPQLAKFEQKIIDCQSELNQTALIIRQFDENISSKAEKHAINELYDLIKKHLNECG